VPDAGPGPFLTMVTVLLWITEVGVPAGAYTSRRHHVHLGRGHMFRRRRTKSSADPLWLHPVPAVSRSEPVQDIYLLFLNRPPDDVPADDGGATVVPATSLYHPELPQPDAQRLLDRLTRHPDRYPGALVFLSDLTAELASEGLSWSQVGIDFEAVTDRLVALHRHGEVWALRLAQLSDLAVTLLASGPHTQIYVSGREGGPPELLDPSIFQLRREELRAMIRADLEHTDATGRR
jgi:hypothetical protein